MGSSKDRVEKKRKGGSATFRDDTKKKQKVLQDGKALAKKNFEAKRAEILDMIPDECKNIFGQICFARWQTRLIPVLILSPFDVPPGEARDGWYTKFEKVRIYVLLFMLDTASFLIVTVYVISNRIFLSKESAVH